MDQLIRRNVAANSKIGLAHWFMLTAYGLGAVIFALLALLGLASEEEGFGTLLFLLPALLCGACFFANVRWMRALKRKSA